MESNEQPTTPAQIAAQILLMDAALIHTWEKALAMTTEGLTAIRAWRADLGEALADEEAVTALRAENTRLAAENERLREGLAPPPAHIEEAAVESPLPAVEVDTGAGDAMAEEPAAEEETTADGAAGDTSPSDAPAPIEESIIFPNAPIW